MLIKQSTTTKVIPFFMVDSTDHITGKTGLTPTVTISKNGAAFGTPTGAVTETGSGWYKIAGNATDSNTLGSLLVHATASGADPYDILHEVVAFDVDATSVVVGTNNDKVGYSLVAAYDAAKTAASPTQVQTELGTYGALKPTVAGRTVDITATGEVGLDLDNTIGTLAKGTEITGFNDITTAQVQTELTTYGALKPTTAGRTLDVTTTGEAGIDWANIGTPATTQNLSATTIATVTNPVVLTAAYDKAKTAAVPGDAMALTTGERTTLSGVIWNVLTSTLSTAGSVGKLLVDNVNATISSRAIAGDSMTLTAGERTTLTNTIWSALTSGLTAAGSIGKLLVDNIDAKISTRSTYAGGDTAGTTTLLTRIASAITITAGKVDVNDKTGFSLVAGYDPAKTAASQASVNAIDTVTDKLDTAMELDGAVYRFTQNALELAPVVGSQGNGGTLRFDDVWKWTTAGSVSSGQIRGNVTDWNTITELWISNVTNGGTNLQAYLKVVAIDDTIRVQQENAPTVWNSYLVTGTPVDMTTWMKIPVSLRMGANVAPPPTATNSLVSFFRVSSTDWTDTEKNQIRYRLGLDGTTVSPVANPNLATQSSVNTINTVTNKLDTAMEQDGPVYRYTVNALEQAPVGGGSGATDWSSTERDQIRNRLGIDGSSSAPITGTPSLAKPGDAMTLTSGERATLISGIWNTLNSALTTVGSIGKLLVDNINATISSRSTYAGTDTAGTTTLLTRIPSALTITSGKVDVNDKTGFSLTAAYDPAKTAMQAGPVTLTAAYDKAKNAAQPLDQMTLTAAYDAAKVCSSQVSVDGVKLNTDHLGTAMEVDGAVYRFTANALELSPGSTSAAGGNKVLLNDIWKWTTTVSASSGQVRGEIADWNNITKLWINYTANSGSDLSTWLRNIKLDDTIRIQQDDDAAVWNSYIVNDIPIDHGTWIEVPVSHSSGAGVPPPVSGKNCSVSFFRFTAEVDWTEHEKSQIRYRLGIDGATSGPIAAPNLSTQSSVNGIATTVNGISTNVTTLLSRITPTLFTGITSLGEWLGLIAGKQTGNANARTELRATGNGSGTYDETLHSLEAIRIHGDDAWVGGGEVPVPPSPDADPCFQNPAQTKSVLTEP